MLSKNLTLTALALVLLTPGFAHAAAESPAKVVDGSNKEKTTSTDTSAKEKVDGKEGSETPASETAAEDAVSGQPTSSATGQNATEKSVPAQDDSPSNATAHSAGTGHHLPKLDWSFNGPFGTYDKASLQRGFLVYKNVCSACHGLNKIYYRNLEALGYTEGQVKTIAAEYTVTDGPNDDGEMFDRPARPSDKLKRPYPNDKAAMAVNNGALPPDLSLITKARHGGADYVYGILTAYADPPEGVTLTPAQHYNLVKDGGLTDAQGKHIPGGILAMAPPLTDGLVTYEDGSPQTVDQYARDVAHFLTWAAEPEMEQRKQMGAKVVIFLAIFAVIVYAVKRKIWANVH